jgi:uncharacterized membrane protein
MNAFLPDWVKAILLGLIAVAFGLNRLAVAFPHLAWLQLFRLPVRQMSEEERARRRRSANRLAGLEMVIAGLVLPLLYFVPTFMMFNEPKPIPVVIVSACSVICIALGIWIFARNF